MGIIGRDVGYRILKRFWPGGETGYLDGSAYKSKNKLEALLGDDVWSKLAGKVVIDFGCGTGAEAIEIALRGAKRVIGVDTMEPLLEIARGSAESAGVADRCIFTPAVDEKADVILSMDAFEHFEQPSEVLSHMRSLIDERGRALVCFGPTWYHPLGGHIFSVFPWAHFVFTEEAFIRWFRDFNPDNHTSFRSVGLNKMTVSRFEKILKQSDWRAESFEAVPIRKLRRLSNAWTREFTTAIVRCELVPK
ncbi:MAG TPA: methyltransferase domain-containing protein [Blastocatellia bacterium]|jgi:SAM-dependent methyltransferase|nr:methyltransferase domain-containing protein [Blastocatellia bacterium]